MKSRLHILLLLGGILLGFSACEQTTDHEPTSSYHYGTENDSARHYFLKGWAEIMDHGRWTESEAAFRKAVDFDSDWLLGKSLVGRISRDIAERERLITEIKADLDQADEDEAKLAEVNLKSIEAAVRRAQEKSSTPESAEARRQLAEQNFGAFARKYPEDAYFKAEYIEFLHANHGAKVALDTLYALATPEQMNLGFYIRYAANMELELGQIEKARALSLKLNTLLTDSTFTSPLMLQAGIYLAQDSLEQAKRLVDQVVEMDSNHLIAKGMQARLLALEE